MTNNQGQTLLEIVVALGVMIFGIVSILSLTTTGIATARTSQNRVIAINLAREGLEVVHGIRDSNWLAKKDWYDGIYFSGEKKAIPVFDPMTGSWKLEFAPAFATIQDLPVYLSSGVYRQSLTAGSVLENSGFSRMLVFTFLEKTLPGNPAPVKVGVQVISRVQWKEKGEIKQVEAEEELYNWR